MPEFGTFDTLTPEVIFTAAEEAFNCRFSGVLLPLPSYINRVYEMESADRERFIIKFYRPGRWSRAALLEEHVFTLEAREASGLFACGEALNVDGACGGYNLAWAWKSGLVAGRAAAESAGSRA